jgi:glycosyltransferase A (GT-A) superfamily protein (DUF2064 family)
MNKTAIILFANLPDIEARVKSFSGFSSKKTTQKISSVLTKHFYQLSRQTSADAFLIDSYHQKGKSFGERITNAFDDVYAKGYENVICIGNDCPELDLNQLQSAITSLESGKVVLGPTKDGGAYLIGVPKSYFDKKSFFKIRWQSHKTYNDIFQNFKNSAAEIIVEYILKYLDNQNDARSYSKSNTLIRVILQQINAFISKFKNKNIFTFTSAATFQNIYFRGPPQPF